MKQKWNLQDIRPVEPRAPHRPASASTIIRDNRQHGGDMQPKSAPSSRQPERFNIDNRPRHETTADFENSETDQSYDTEDRISVTDGRHKNRKHLITATIIFFIVASAGILLSYLTGGATVTVFPKHREINVNAEFTAYKQEQPEELTYEILTLEATGERQVSASGQETVTSQTKGEIEIKKITDGAERLIKNTRFATADGRIFRIEESVVVPGALKDSTGKLVPGTTRAKVFAEEAGDQYNLLAGTALTIPGFKENGFTELYQSITASNVETLTGGFKGQKFIINEQELATARQSLQMELRNSLLERSKTERPQGFTTFEGAVAISYSQLPQVQYGENLVTIKEQAVLQLPLFSAADFASFIAKESIVGYDRKDRVRIDNVEELIFSYSNATTSQSLIGDADSITFKIAGEPKIVWSYDEGRLKAELLGVQKTAIPQIMSSYTGIERSEVRVRPVWQRTMPGDTNNITIIESLLTETRQ